MKRGIGDLLLAVVLAAASVHAGSGLQSLGVEVRAGGRPVAGATVLLVCGKGGEKDVIRARARTGKDGRARLSLDSSTSQGCVVWAGGVERLGVSWTPTDRATVELNLPAAVPVRLEAVDARSGKALSPEGVELRADLKVGGRRPPVKVPAGLLSIAEDQAAHGWAIHGLPRVPHGRADLRIVPAGYAGLLLRAIPLGSKAKVDLGTVEFREAASLCGAVRGITEGGPVLVHVQPASGGPAVKVQPEADGGFCVADLQAGVVYDLWASSLYGESAVRKVAPPAAGIELALPRPRRVSGRVVDADGEPVVRFTVSVMPSAAAESPQLKEALRDFTVTRHVEDASGRFEVLIPGELEATVRIEAEGFAPHELVVSRRRSLAAGEVHLRPGLTVRGMVLEELSGDPIPDGSVAAFCAGHRIGAATTDSDGEFELRGLPRERCRLEAEAPGFARAAHRLDLKKGNLPDEVRLVLEPALAISGRVLDAGTGEPVVGARITAMPMPTGSDTGIPGSDAAGLEARSGSDGGFRIDGCRRGPYVLVVAAEGYVPASLTVQAAESAPPLRVELVAGVVVEGTVLGARGDGVGLRVVLQQGGKLLDATTAYGGSYRIEGVPSGTVSFSVLGKTQRTGLCSGSFFVPPGATTLHEDLDCRAGPFTLSGTLSTATGSPASSVVLFLQGVDIEGARYQTAVGADGRFVFEGVAAGTYRLLASVPGQRSIALWQGDLRGDMELSLVVNRGP